MATIEETIEATIEGDGSEKEGDWGEKVVSLFGEHLVFSRAACHGIEKMLTILREGSTGTGRDRQYKKKSVEKAKKFRKAKLCPRYTYLFPEMETFQGLDWEIDPEVRSHLRLYGKEYLAQDDIYSTASAIAHIWEQETNSVIDLNEELTAVMDRQYVIAGGAKVLQYLVAEKKDKFKETRKELLKETFVDTDE